MPIGNVIQKIRQHRQESQVRQNDPHPSYGIAKKQARQLERKRGNLGNIVHTLCFLGMCNMAVIAGPLFDSQWVSAKFYSPEIGTAEISTGLFTINVRLGCNGEHWSNACTPLEKLQVEGEHTLISFMGKICSARHVKLSACDDLQTLWYIGWASCFFFGCACCAQLFSSCFLWYYWHIKSLPIVRKFAQSCVFSGPFLLSSGLLYFFKSLPDLVQFMQALANDEAKGKDGRISNVFAQNMFLGYAVFRNFNKTCVGRSFFCAGMAWFFSCFSCVLMACCMEKSSAECDYEDKQELEKESDFRDAFNSGLIEGETPMNFGNFRSEGMPSASGSAAVPCQAQSYAGYPQGYGDTYVGVYYSDASASSAVPYQPQSYPSYAQGGDDWSSYSQPQVTWDYAEAQPYPQQY